MTRNRDYPFPIARDNVLTLAHDSKSHLFERTHCSLMRNPGNWHSLALQHNFAFLTISGEFLNYVQILANCIANVCERLILGGTLRGATRKPRNPNAITLIRLLQRNNIAG